MTNYQYKICRIIVRYKHLGKILAKVRVGDYLDLQLVLDVDALTFADDNFDDNTLVGLSTKWTEDFENHRRGRFNRRFTNVIAVLALIISAISLLSQIGLIRLPQYSASQPTAAHYRAERGF